MELAAICLVVVVALAFAFTNGFHDTSTAIATSVSTRALTPRIALLLATVMNLIGALLGTGVARTVGSDIIDTPSGEGSLLVVFAALVGAVIWNLGAWYLGLGSYGRPPRSRSTPTASPSPARCGRTSCACGR